MAINISSRFSLPAFCWLDIRRQICKPPECCSYTAGPSILFNLFEQFNKNFAEVALSLGSDYFVQVFVGNHANIRILKKHINVSRYVFP